MKCVENERCANRLTDACEHCKRCRDNNQDTRNAFGDNFEESQSYRDWNGFSYGKRIETPEEKLPFTEKEAWAIIESGYKYKPRRTTSTIRRRNEKRLKEIGYE